MIKLSTSICALALFVGAPALAKPDATAPPAPTAAPTASQNLDSNKIVLIVDSQEMNVIATALMDQPMKVAEPVMTDLRRQVQVYLAGRRDTSAASAPSAESAKTP